METEEDPSHSDEFPCGGGTMLAQTGCILSYAGSTKDIVLNYIMVVINLLYCVAAVLANQKQTDEQRIFALGALIFVILFQITLCLVLGCAGISIIWCAMGGWIMSERRRVVENNIDASSSLLSTSSQRLINMGKVVIFLDCVVIVYYGVVEEPITTVAHFCALVLGAMLSLMSIRIFEPQTDALERTSSEPLVVT
jgi:hypothetical protein